MLFERIPDQVACARQKMIEQTGIDVGGPTRLCLPFVNYSLSGKVLDYRERLDVLGTPGIRGDEILELSKLGLRFNRAVFYTPRKFEGLKALLSLGMNDYDAVTVSGKYRHPEQNVYHIIAAVVSHDSNEFAVVDSLLAGGMKIVGTPEAVVEYVERAFYEETLLVDALLTPELLQKEIMCRGTGTYCQYITDDIGVQRKSGQSSLFLTIE